MKRGFVILMPHSGTVLYFRTGFEFYGSCGPTRNNFDPADDSFFGHFFDNAQHPFLGSGLPDWDIL